MDWWWIFVDCCEVIDDVVVGDGVIVIVVDVEVVDCIGEFYGYVVEFYVDVGFGYFYGVFVVELGCDGGLGILGWWCCDCGGLCWCDFGWFVCDECVIFGLC